MSTFDQGKVFALPGQLFIDVTNMTSPSTNYGGKAVGYYHNGEIVVYQEDEDVLSEAIGKRTGKLVAETLVSFEFDYIQFDTDVLAKMWTLTGNGTLREGSTGLLATAGPALFVPLDSTRPGFLLYAPVFRHGAKRIPHYQEEKRAERVVADACDNSSGHTYACDLVANLTLP